MIDLKQAIAESNIDVWVQFIKTAEIPVLKRTARDINLLREDEDSASTRDISIILRNDPMMVFKVLSYAQNHKGSNQTKDLLKVEQALIMMGMSTFFNKIPPSPLVEDQLTQNLSDLVELLKLITRAHRAANYAVEFAAYLVDLHAEEIRIAALLHDLAEMLMWCFNTEKMRIISARQKADITLRSKIVQKEVLGFELCDLQNALVTAFSLPPLLGKLMDENSAESSRVRNVLVAVNLARHVSHGWDDAALPDDFKEIADLLHVDISRVKHLIGAPQNHSSN